MRRILITTPPFYYYRPRTSAAEQETEEAERAIERWIEEFLEENAAWTIVRHVPWRERGHIVAITIFAMKKDADANVVDEIRGGSTFK